MKKIGVVKTYKVWSPYALSYKLQELEICKNNLRTTEVNLVMAPVFIFGLVRDLINNQNPNVTLDSIGLGVVGVITIASLIRCTKNIKKLKVLREEVVGFLKKYEPGQFKTDEDAQQLSKRI